LKLRKIKGVENRNNITNLLVCSPCQTRRIWCFPSSNSYWQRSWNEEARG